MATHRLRTTVQIASRRAAALKAEAHAADWTARLDPAAYTCRREGTSWIAEGPAGQSFDYSKTEHDDVLCISHTGGIYLLMVGDDGELTCDCPASRRGAAPCKHLVGFDAVRAAHKEMREGVRRALAAEAAAMNEEREPAAAPPAEALYNLVCVTSDGERTVMLEGVTMARIGSLYPYALTGERMSGGQYFTVEPAGDDPAESYRDYYEGEEL
jgi:hypothetical protein